MPGGLYRDGQPAPDPRPSGLPAGQPDAYGQFYPESWPAGPWVVVAVWLTTIALAALLHWIG
jgi:hypothetical protein